MGATAQECHGGMSLRIIQYAGVQPHLGCEQKPADNCMKWIWHKVS